LKRRDRLELLLSQKRVLEEALAQEKRFAKMRQLIAEGMKKSTAAKAVASNPFEIEQFLAAIWPNRELTGPLNQKAYREVIRQLQELRSNG